MHERGQHLRLWALIVSFAVVATALLILRRPDAITNPQLWAEDAVVFHAHAEAQGWGSLLHPNAGYFHTVPRLVALAARWFDPRFIPAIYNGAATLIALAVGLAILRSRLPGGHPVAFGCAVAFIVVPHYSHEVFLNLTNVQWVLASYLVIVLLRAAPATRIRTALTVLAVALAGLTSPFSAALVPLAAWRFGQTRTPAGRTVFATLLVTGLIQGAAAVWAGQASLPGTASAVPFHAGPLTWLGIFGFRGVMEAFWFPGWWPAADVTSIRIGAGIAGLLLLGLIAAWPGAGRVERGLLVATILIFATITAIRIRPYAIELPDRGWGDRYFLPLRVWLAWGVLLLLPVLSRRLLVLPWLALAAFAATAIPFYQGKAWDDFRWADHVEAIRPGVPADIPTNPYGWTYHYTGRP